MAPSTRKTENIAKLSASQALNLNWDLWTPEDGHGSDEQDYQEWKLYDPTMEDVEFILQNITKEMLDGSSTSKIVPRRVKLSDSGMGLIICLGVTVQKTFVNREDTPV